MTNRQWNIFEALKRAYDFVRWAKRETDINLDDVYESYLQDANENKLTTIEQLATLFFLGVAKYGDL